MNMSTIIYVKYILILYILIYIDNNLKLEIQTLLGKTTDNFKTIDIPTVAFMLVSLKVHK